MTVHEHLHQAACTFNFFKAVHLLELFAGGISPGQGISPSQDPVRFCVRPGLSFPASDIDEVAAQADGAAPRMAVNFMGLIGPQGVLPDWYNIYAQNANYRKEHSFTDFLDMFHHRLLSLFYLAWKKYRLVENYRTDGSDPISTILSHLAGVSESGQAADPEFFAYTHKRLIHFCGLVARCVPTAAAIETIVAHTVGAPVRVEQFVERLLPVHEQDRTCLGRRNCSLKKDVLCGRRVRDGASFFRVHIGPLPWKEYMALLPHSRKLALIRQLIAHLAGIEYEFEIRLIIKGSEVPALQLGSGNPRPKLGRTASLRRPQQTLKKNIFIKA
jgi:type VI secretion system protein ImpH